MLLRYPPVAASEMTLPSLVLMPTLTPLTRKLSKAAFSTLDLIICTSYQDNMPLKEVYLPLLRPLGNIVRFSTGSFPATH